MKEFYLDSKATAIVHHHLVFLLSIRGSAIMWEARGVVKTAYTPPCVWKFEEVRKRK